MTPRSSRTIYAACEDIALGAGSAPGWPELFLEAIRVGADLSKVWPEYAAWLLTDPADGVMRFVNEDQLDPHLSKQVRESIESIAQLFRTDCADIKQWSAAMMLAFKAKESADDALSLKGRESDEPCPYWAATNAVSAAAKSRLKRDCGPRVPSDSGVRSLFEGNTKVDSKCGRAIHLEKQRPL